MGYIYNHDIIVDEELAAQFPKISSLLKWQPLIDAFLESDVVARWRKARLLFWGRLALGLTLLALLGVTTELLAAALDVHFPVNITITIEVLALAAVACFLINRFQRNRSEYLLQCFSRERLRHWRFQLFLDGALISRITTDKQGVFAEIERRLAAFKEDLRSAEGTLRVFLRSPVPAKLLHDDTLYTDRGIADEVFTALEFIRFRHQAQYPQRKVAPEPSDQRISIREQYHWAEAISRGALLLAVVIPAVQLVLVNFRNPDATLAYETLHISLFALCLGLAVLSATARSYCAGMSLPEEIESYEHYASHVDTLYGMFRSSTNDEARRDCLHHLEVEAERELRRFLTMKEKASFLA